MSPSLALIALHLLCSPVDPELPSAQPYAIGRSGDQNETMNPSGELLCPAGEAVVN